MRMEKEKSGAFQVFHISKLAAFKALLTVI